MASTARVLRVGKPMDVWLVLALASLPALGSVTGAVAAEWTHIGRRPLGVLLHAAAGIAIALFSIELIPRIIDDMPGWWLIVAFGAGALVSAAVAHGVQLTTRLLRAGSPRPWMIHLAAMADLFTDGLMVGIGAVISSGLGLLLAVSQLIGNMPGGFVTIATLREKSVSPRARRLAALSLAGPAVAGAMLGFWLLRDTSPALRNAALAFVGGLLLLAVIEDVVPEADEPRAPRWQTTIAFTAGFAFFSALALYIDE